MRLIGTFDTEKEAYAFYSFLLKEGIQNIYEPYHEEKQAEKRYRIWVYDEDDLDVAVDWFNRYKENPQDPKFQSVEMPVSTAPPSRDYAEISAAEEQKWQSVPRVHVKVRRFSFTLTHMIILICTFLFLWNDVEEAAIYQDKGPVAVQISLTPLWQNLLFDVPASYRYIAEVVSQYPLNNYKEVKDLPPDIHALLQKAQDAPAWKGLYAYFLTAKHQGWKAANDIPMFEKIREGQLWRLFTPVLLHAGFLHILFNMIWVWILSKQIEARLAKWKVCLMILAVAVISNTAQYFVSGPDFIGFSGVVCGMAGFIWMRQRKAPWEGYPLDRGTLLFLFFFVVAMLGLELVMFGLRLFSIVEITPVIANTAHIVGGLVGIVLGRLSFFARRMS